MTLDDLIAAARRLITDRPDLRDEVEEIVSYVRCEIEDEGSVDHEVQMGLDDLRKLVT
jgi:hypothetical protein